MVVVNRVAAGCTGLGQVLGGLLARRTEPGTPEVERLDDLWRPAVWRRDPTDSGFGPPAAPLDEGLFYGAAGLYRTASWWMPEAAYVPANLAATWASLVAARHLGLDATTLGLRRERVRRGVAVGLVAGGVVAAGLGIIASTSLRSVLADARFVGVDAGEAVYQALIRIPLGTAVFEEVLFRGVILGLLLRRVHPVWAIVDSALLFGLWHSPDTLEAVFTGSFAPGDVVVTLGRIVGTLPATAAAGLALGWLRLRANSVVAPTVVHAALNATAYLVGWWATTHS